MKNTYLKRIILISLIIINCIIIFNFSAQKADESSSTSGKIVDVVMKNVYKKQKIEKEKEQSIRNTVSTLVRKSAHFSIYLCLGVLTYLYTGTYKINKKKRVLYAIIFCIIYASSDEFHQRFVDGRSGEIRDVCIDTCGSGFGMLIVIATSKIVNLIKKK